MLYLSRTKRHKYINSGNFDIVIYQGYWSFFIQLVVIVIVLNTAKVDDMTLAKGNVLSFNTGWTMIRENSEETALD